MIIHKLQQFSKWLIRTERSERRLAMSTCLGIFIAFSPFVGLHSFMAISLAWLLSFNVAITLLVSSIINNPWTMVPVYSCDYFFGKWLCTFDFMSAVPALFSSLCDPLIRYIGLSSDVVWVFFLGGNILSVLLAIVMYPFIRWMIEQLRIIKSHNLS